MGIPEIPTTGPLDSRQAERFRLKVDFGDEKFQKVIAEVIASSIDGKPVIKLGDAEVDHVSGGGAIDQKTGKPVLVQPHNVVLRTSGDKLSVMELPDNDPPFETPFRPLQ